MSETGHSKNVTNFSQVIAIVSGLNTDYQPNNPLIALTNLQAKEIALQTAFTAVIPAESAESLAINERVAVFEPLSKLVTRISNAAEVSINDPLFSNNLRSIVRKLQGRRAPGQTASDDKKNDNGENSSTPEEVKTRNSSSQMGYDDRVANFFELITLLKTQGSYNPNETELKIATLETMLADMQAKNTAAVNASIAAKNARIARDAVFYNDTDGILALVNLVKKYVKSVFGAGSPQYKQLTVLKFKKP